ncbi:MAG: bacteriophage holin [Kutzneria sp.]|nr:bacteriophage holin [Kutzneria sp.]
MSYLASASLVVLGLALLVVAMLRVARSLRGLAAANASTRSRFADQAGLIRARLAALGVAVAQRRRIGWGRQPGGAEGR